MMRRLPSILVLAWGLLGATTVGTPDRAARAQEPPAERSEPSPLRYRRVYVPQDRTKEWPYGSVRYVPMDKAEFERLVDAGAAGPGSFAASPARALASTQYSARLVGDDLVDGKAEFDVRGLPEGPTLVPLAPCGLAIGEAVWASGDRQPAKLASAGDGRVFVWSEHSGQLLCTWSLRGRRDPLGTLEFPLELPACPSNRLTLDLPKGLVPSVERGVVLPEGTGGDASPRWRIELGGHHRVRLRLAPSEAPGTKLKANTVRQETTYEFSARGVGVSAQLWFDVPGESMRQVVLRPDAGLQLTAAQYGELPVPWSVVPGSAKGAETRIVLELPEPVRGFSRSLRLAATAPLEIDRRWRLPGFRVEDAFWEEGHAALVVPAPLVLQELSVLGGRQTGAGPLPSPRLGESAEVQYHSPGGGVQIVLATARSPLQVDAGTALALDAVEMTARYIGNMRVAAGERFELNADVPRPWAIDSVETDPAGVLGSWDFRPDAAGGGKLAVRLARPLSPARPIRLLVTARHVHSPLGQVFVAEDLTPLRFPGASAGKRLVAIRVPDAFHLSLGGDDGLSRIDPAGLSAGDLGLLAEPPVGTLFDANGAGSGLQVSMERKTPRYGATIRVDAAVSERTLVESYRIQCVPEGSQVDRLLVHFSRARNAPFEWGLDAGDDRQLKVRPWQAAGRSGPSQGETWEVLLRQARSTPFEVRATRTSPMAQPTPVGLVSLPEAASQRGTLVVGSSGPGSVHVRGKRLTPLPAEPPSADRAFAPQGTYRYDPLQETGADGEAGAVLTLDETRLGPPTAWAWSCQLESRYEADGSGQHLAAFRVQNAGRDRLEIDLPPPLTQANVLGVWLDEARVPWRGIASRSGRSVVVALSPERKSALLSIHFSTEGPPLRAISSIEPVLPKIDAPTLARTWTVWLPPGYQVINRPPGGPRGVEPGTTAAERLFGPLGRGAGSSPFRPWVAGDWGQLIAWRPEAAPASAEAGQVTEPRADAETGTPQQSEGASTPWPAADLASHGLAAPLGRTAYRIELTGTDGVRLSVVHRATLCGLGWAAFLVAFALGVWRRLLRPEWLTLLAGVAAAAALLLPEVYSPPASGTFLGAVAAALFRWGRRVKPPATIASDSTVSLPPWRPSAVPGRIGVFLAAALALEAQACAQPAPGAAAEPRTVHNVFIPIDAQEKPVGDKYYVPEGLFGQLQRLAAGRSTPPQGWLIHEAAYRGAMTWRGPGEPMALDELKATFDLEVYARHARVRIPLGGGGVRPGSQGPLLEGRALQVDPAAPDGQLVFDVTDPGRYRLDVPLRATLPSSGVSTAFDVKIPPVAASRLELAVPPDGPGIEVPSAIGAVVREKEPSRVTAQLGPADRLTIRWQEGGARTPSAVPLDVEQLLWLKVQPGSVVLETKVKLKAVEASLRQFSLATDPRLKLLPGTKELGPAPRVETISGQPQILRFEVPPPGTEPRGVQASLLLTGHPGVGPLRLPYCDVPGARVTKRWLAVSVDPGLEHDEQTGVGVEPSTAASFMTAWGEAKAQPTAAYQLVSPRPEWSLSTRPASPRTTADQTLSLRCERAGIRVRFEAWLNTGGGVAFQHVVNAPPDLQVQRVSVLEGESQRLARWSQAPDGTLCLFLSGPVSGRQSLSLEGWLPAPAGGTLPLGAVGVKAEEVKSSVVHLFRRPSVRLEVANAAGLAETPAPAGDAERSPLDRWAKSYRVQGRVPPGAVLKLSPNQPKTVARQVTALRREAGAWRGEVRFKLRVRDGLVDELRVETPATWTGPFSIDPPAAVEVVRSTDRARRVLVIRPGTPIAGESSLTISSPLAFPPAERIGLGEVSLEGAETTDRILVLPVQTDLGPLAWEPLGLTPAPVPEEYAPPGPERGSVAAYRAGQQPFHALLKAAERPRGSPQVLLADVSATWQADGTCFGVAVFDLEPAGRGECTVRLPPGARLIQATAGDLPVACAAVDDTTWRVPLDTSDLPKRIEVLFSHAETDPVAAGSRRLCAPGVLDWPVRQTLWTLCGPSGFEVTPDPGVPAADRLDQELVRLRTTTEVIEKGVSLPTYEPDAMSQWYRLWARRWIASQDQVRRLLTESEPTEAAEAAREELEAIQRRVALVAERLGIGEVLAQVAQTMPPSEAPVALWRRNLEQSPSVLRSITDQAPQEIAFTCRHSPGEPLWGRLLGALGIAAAAGVLAVGVRREATLSALRRRLPLAGVAIGLAWWLWLRPSVVGCLIAGVSIVVWWTRRRKARRIAGGAIRAAPV